MTVYGIRCKCGAIIAMRAATSNRIRDNQLRLFKAHYDHESYYSPGKHTEPLEARVERIL